MEWVLFALLVWFFFARSKKKPAKKALSNAKKKFATAQKQYDDFLNSLPDLQGDGSFSQQVSGEMAYRETIDLYGQYLKENYDPDTEFFVLVELEPDNQYDKNAVRVEMGQATVGYIPRDEAESFGGELRQLGGQARASAKLYWSAADGKSSLTLDIVRPLRARS